MYNLNQGRWLQGYRIIRQHISTNMHWQLVEGNFKDEHGNIMKLAITECCKMHMEYVTKGDRVANLGESVTKI
jgi:hypothetical protein